MRSNFGTPAAAFLLFGGTLGAVNGASAGVVPFGGADAANSWCAFDVSAYNPSSGYSDQLAFASGNPVTGSVSLSDPTYGSAVCSAFSASGVSISTAFAAPSFATGAAPSITFRQAFVVTSDVIMSWAALLPAGGGLLRIDTVGRSGSIAVTYWDGANNSLTLEQSAAGEHYLLSYSSYGPAIQSGAVLSVAFSEVPVPGALTLLGIAGLASSRRRR
jgi:hypothetical protein